jgi:branched-chain amino acid transport system ATP-binding protein
MAPPALQIAGLQAWYGAAQILQGIDMVVEQGEAVALLGRHGAGLTFTLRAVLGQTGARLGSIRIHGVESIHLSAPGIALLGIAFCPGRLDIASGLSCEENLLLPLPLPGSGALGGGMSLSEIYELFPELLAKRAWAGARLDEGEWQMLAVGRVLRTGANLLLFDDICKGLPDPLVRVMGHTLNTLKSLGYSIVLTERTAQVSNGVADRFYVMEHGHTTEEYDATDDTANDAASNAKPNASPIPLRPAASLDPFSMIDASPAADTVRPLG